MGIKRIGCSFFVFALSFFSQSSFAFENIDYAQYFPNVIQGHHGTNGRCENNSPQLVLYDAQINGTNGVPLSYCTSNEGNGLGSQTCDDGSSGYQMCEITDADIDGIDFTATGNLFLQSTGNTGISWGNCTNNDVLGPGITEFGSIIIDKNNCELSFVSSPTKEYRLKSFILDKKSIVNLTEGDYWIESFIINGGTPIINVTGNVRFFVRNSTAINGELTVNENADSTFTFVAYNNVDFNSSGVEFNGYLYSDGNITVNRTSTFNGRITSRKLVINDDTTVNDAYPQPIPFHIQYGKATSNTVTFDEAFPVGATPLIFLMPTVSETNTNTDGPASVALVEGSITENGFSWAQQEPPSPDNRYNDSNPMPEVHWIAVNEGTHDLSNGTQLIAGTIEQDNALIGANNQYVNVTLPSTQNILLNQLQTSNNDCWLTSTSQFNNAGIQLAMDTSEVRSNNSRCQPGNLNNNQIQAETIAYLTVASGSGALVLNGDNFNYHFGEAQTFTASNIQNIASQCAFTTPLVGFTETPILVAGKNSRRGGDGGWLRRCQLTNDIVSMAVDEDTYRDNDRSHIWENYSFLALEKVEPLTQCFTDDFNRGSLGTDWVAASSSGNFTPSIVSNRLQLTEAVGNQATSTTFQRLFPAADNLIEIEFDHFAYNGNGADGIALVFSDASVTPQPGSAGGPLGYGYRGNVSGFAGGWLGIGIDEYGNFSAEGGDTNIGRRRQSVAIRGSGSGTSGYPYLRGTCNNGTSNTTGDCLSPTVDDNNTSPAHRYKIIIDSRVSGQSLVSVSRDTGSGFVEIIPQFDALSIPTQADVPADFILSITGSTGGSHNIHAIDDVEFCALDSSPVGVVIDHFEFTHTGAALTCNAEPMTLKACANADCSQTVPDFVTATLSPTSIATGGGWVGGNVVSFSNGSTSLELRNNVASSVTVDVSGSSPGAKPFSTTLCSIAGNTPTAAQCTFNFADSGFIFDVPDKLANKPISGISISAVKKSDVSEACVPQFANVTKSVGFWSDYVSPSTVISGSQVAVTGSGIATNIGTSVGARTPISLVFDANGVAEFDVNYPDAGQMQLNAQYDGAGDESGLVMIGADTFVSFPVGLCVKPVDTNASCTANVTSDCDVYKKAGDEFDLSIQGMAWESDGDVDFCDNLSTPNYIHPGMTLGSELIAPKPGEDGSLSLGNYDHVATIDNTNTITQSISEVGVFKFTVKPPLSYESSFFYNIPLASSGNIGRFVPDRFAISGVSVIAACTNFNYMEQPFPLAMNISAFNIGNEVTKNYQGNFSYATALLVGEDSDDGDDKRNRLSALPISASSWVAGVATVDSSYMATLSRLAAPGKDGPFDNFDIGVVVEDNDGNYAYVADPDMNAATSGNCTSNCDAKLLSNQRFRHGRVVMDNTYGAENDTLQMATRAEYWDGSSWVHNIEDSCSVVIPALSTQTDDAALGYQFEPALVAGQAITRTGQSTSFANGEFTLLWNAVITGTTDYRGQVTAPLSVPNWLQWYWDWDAMSSTTLYDPRASAFFGRYRGHDRIIYWREVR